MRAAWWWIDRWRKSTAYTDMTAEEQGMYRNLLDELWLRGGALPDNEKALAQASGDYEAWRRCRDTIMARFYKASDGWRNETHDEIAKESERRASKQRRYRERKSSGNGGGNADSNVTGNSDGDVTRSPSPSPSQISEGSIGSLTGTSSAGADASTSEKVELSFEQKFVNLWNGLAVGAGIALIRLPLSNQRRRHVRGWQKLVKGDTEALELVIRWFVDRRLCDDAGVPRGITTFLRPSHREGYLEQARAWDEAGRPPQSGKQKTPTDIGSYLE